jgi:hypothetical protein
VKGKNQITVRQTADIATIHYGATIHINIIIAIAVAVAIAAVAIS